MTGGEGRWEERGDGRRQERRRSDERRGERRDERRGGRPLPLGVVRRNRPSAVERQPDGRHAESTRRVERHAPVRVPEQRIDSEQGRHVSLRPMSVSVCGGRRRRHRLERPFGSWKEPVLKRALGLKGAPCPCPCQVRRWAILPTRGGCQSDGCERRQFAPPAGPAVGEYEAPPSRGTACACLEETAISARRERQSSGSGGSIALRLAANGPAGMGGLPTTAKPAGRGGWGDKHPPGGDEAPKGRRRRTGGEEAERVGPGWSNAAKSST